MQSRKETQTKANYWYQLKFLYGITKEQYQKAFKKQGGKCAVCGKKSHYALVVDHDHSTGKFRGLLCRSCNVAIGNLGDDADGLRRALRYLENK